MGAGIPNGEDGVTLPSSVFGVGVGGQTDMNLENRQQSAVQGALRDEKQPQIDSQFGDFMNNTPNFLRLLGVLTGVGGGGIWGGLGGLVGSRWDQLDAADLALYDKETRLLALEGVIGYGSSRMNAAFTPGTSFARVPFSTSFGPQVGVTHNSAGYYTLGSKGLWEFSAKVIFDFLLFGSASENGLFMDIVVYTPGGAEFYRAKNLVSTGTEHTMNETGRFVVPASGYRVEIQARCGVSYRGMLGVTGYNQFNLVKISDETT